MVASLPEAARASMTPEVAIVTMAKTLFGAEPGAPAAAATPQPAAPQIPTVNPWAAGSVAVPTQRHSPAQAPGVDLAVNELSKWMQEQQANSLPADGGTSMSEFFG
jgi:hypothetical protein